MRWVFGEPALPQTERYAAVMRQVTSLVLSMEQPSETVAELIAALERAEADLSSEVPPDPRPRVGEHHPAEGRVYVDHAYDIGDYNPAFPGYEIQVNGDQATGTVSFPVIYEGPPGLVHGGFLALFFDCAIQHHNCELGTAGKTTDLELSYHRPTPLLTTLRFELVRNLSGERIASTGSLYHGDKRCVTATMQAVAGKRATLPPVSGRRRSSGPRGERS